MHSIILINQINTDTSLGPGKKCLDFNDPDLIFKVTLILRNSHFGRKKRVPNILEKVVSNINHFLQLH